MGVDTIELLKLNDNSHSSVLDGPKEKSAEGDMEGSDGDEEVGEAAHGPEGEAAIETDATRDAMSTVSEVDKTLEVVEVMDLEAATAAGPSTNQGISGEPKGSTSAAATASPTGAPCLLCFISVTAWLCNPGALHKPLY